MFSKNLRNKRVLPLITYHGGYLISRIDGYLISREVHKMHHNKWDY